MSTRASRKDRRNRIVLAAIALGLAGAGLVSGNVAGLGDKAHELADKVHLALFPPPDRPIDDVALVTPRPSTGAAPESLAPGATATPKPVRKPVDVNLYSDPASHFITEVDHEWCAVAATQMVLAAYGKAPLTEAFQAKLAGRIGEWESRRDSHNGGWGPAAMVKALSAYDVPGFELRAYASRADALVDAARALEATHAPVLLLAWRGAHTWVMTGFKATADPAVFDDAKITGTYILDPWYPRNSSIWGQSDPPGTFQDQAEMKRNYLAWQRPEGSYPTRDGLWIAVVPTVPIEQP